MTTNADLLVKMGASVKNLHDATCDLLFCVESIIVAKDVLHVVHDVKPKCAHRLSATVASSQSASVEIDAVILAFVPGILAADHGYAKELNNLNIAISAFMSVTRTINASQPQQLELEVAREAFMAKQATDLHSVLVEMLVPIRTTKSLIQAIKDLAEAQSNSTTTTPDSHAVDDTTA